MARFVRFVAVGASNFGASYVLFLALYAVAGFGYLTANFLTFFFWVYPGFELQRVVVFRSARRFAIFAKYFVVQVISLAVGTGVLFASVEFLEIAPAFGYLLAIATNALLVYFLSLTMVFKTTKFRFTRK